jgi:hypothetical protein
MDLFEIYVGIQFVIKTFHDLSGNECLHLRKLQQECCGKQDGDSDNQYLPEYFQSLFDDSQNLRWSNLQI